MRTDLSTILQTLTPEAAVVINQSIAEAARRSHGQTTPVHVAATLLSAPTGLLRQACIRSHPNSSHPLQCRPLELCFSVALERIPTSSSTAAAEPLNQPPISNALMAALKRAQAHQRRGCPELQQQPLLAVKVELEQLVISILDDPSVSRVMREAKFSSPAVKAAVEQSLNSNNPPISTLPTSGLGYRGVGIPVPVPLPGSMNRNLYLNPRLQQTPTAQSGPIRGDEVKRVVEIMGRAKKRNPILVGDSEPGRIISEIQNKIKGGVFQDFQVKNVEMVQLEEFSSKFQELGGYIESLMGNSDLGGIILNLGDLKWLVESNSISRTTQPVVEIGRPAVAELRKLLETFGERIWFIGTATCETFLRCQVYHPSMENEWDLQAVPVAAKTPSSGMFPRLGNNGILSVEPLTPLRNFPTLRSNIHEKVDPAGTMNCCPQCFKNYQQELSEVKPETAQLKQLPQWLQNAKAGDRLQSAKNPELQKKWNEMCSRLHPSYHKMGVPTPLSVSPGLSNPNLLLHQSLNPKLQANRNFLEPVRLSSNLVAKQTKEQDKSPPASPVRTELALGRPKVVVDSVSERVQVKDLLSSVEQNNKSDVLQIESENLGKSLDVDLFKQLIKGLSKKVWWQHDAAAVVASTVSQCKLGNTKRQGVSSKSDVWLLFSGPDRAGKRKMAAVLSDLVYGNNPIIINLGLRRDEKEAGLRFRGKTVLDRIAETVRRSPFSVIMLEDIDEADLLLSGRIKQAMERGRLSDSHGREISLGNIIFILTANWGVKKGKSSASDDEERSCDFVNGGWSLRLCLSERASKLSKRRPSWLHDDKDRSTKPKRENGLGFSFDLNEIAEMADDNRPDGSVNSSDLTVDIDQEDQGFVNSKLSLQYVPFAFHDLVSCVDDAVVFRPVDFGPMKRNVVDSLAKRFSDVVGHSLRFEIEDDAAEKIVGGVWVGQMGLDEWINGVVNPCLNRLKLQLRTLDSGCAIARLELDDESDDRSSCDMLPRGIRLVAD